MTIKIIKGDILNSNSQYIIHQCNCVTKNAGGLAKAIFDKYPYANTYISRNNSSTLGSIEIKGDGKDERFIINMYAQFYPGKPNYNNDSYENRKQWFYECLLKISKIKNLKSVAIPFGIGCNLAGGNWIDYYKMICDFDKSVNIQIIIYKLE